MILLGTGGREVTDVALRAQLGVVDNNALSTIRAFRAEIVAIGQTAGTTAQVNVDTSAARTAIAALNAETRAVTAATNAVRFSADTVAAKTAIDQLNADTRALTASANALKIVADTSDASAKIRQLAADTAAMNAEARILKINADSAPAILEIRKIEAEAKLLSAQNPTIKVSADTRDAESSLTRVKEIAGGIFAGNLGYDLARSAFSGVSDAAFGMNSRLEQSALSLTTLTGSAQIATNTMAGLRDLASHSSFGLEQLQGGAQEMLAFGASADGIVPLLKAVGTAAAASGGDIQDKFSRITYVVAEMSSGMALSERQIRELAMAGVPLKDLAASLGVTVEQLNNAGKTGALTGQQVVQGLQQMYTGGKFGDFLADQAKTGAGAVQLIKTNIGLAVADGLKPIYEEMAKVAVSFANFTQSQQFAADMEQVRSAASTAATVLGALISTTEKIPAPMIGAALQIAGLATSIKLAQAGGELLTGLGTKLGTSFSSLAPAASASAVATSANAAAATEDAVATAAAAEAHGADVVAMEADTVATETNTAAKLANAGAGAAGGAASLGSRALAAAGPIGTGLALAVGTGMVLQGVQDSQDADLAKHKANVFMDTFNATIKGKSQPEIFAQTNSEIDTAQRKLDAMHDAQKHQPGIDLTTIPGIGGNYKGSYVTDSDVKAQEAYLANLKKINAENTTGAASSPANDTGAADAGKIQTQIDGLKRVDETRKYLAQGMSQENIAGGVFKDGSAEQIYNGEAAVKSFDKAYQGAGKSVDSIKLDKGLAGLAADAPGLHGVVDDLARLGATPISGITDLDKLASVFETITKQEEAASQAYDGFMLTLSATDTALSNLDKFSKKFDEVLSAAQRAQQAGTATPDQLALIANAPNIRNNITQTQGTLQANQATDIVGQAGAMPDFAAMDANRRAAVKDLGGGQAIVQRMDVDVTNAKAQIKALVEGPFHTTTVVSAVNPNGTPFIGPMPTNTSVTGSTGTTGGQALTPSAGDYPGPAIPAAAPVTPIPVPAVAGVVQAGVNGVAALANLPRAVVQTGVNLPGAVVQTGVNVAGALFNPPTIPTTPPPQSPPPQWPPQPDPNVSPFIPGIVQTGVNVAQGAGQVIRGGLQAAGNALGALWGRGGDVNGGGGTQAATPTTTSSTGGGNTTPAFNRFSDLSWDQYQSIVKSGSMGNKPSPLLTGENYKALMGAAQKYNLDPRFMLATLLAEGHMGTDPGLAAASVNNFGGEKWAGQNGATNSGIEADNGGTYAAFPDAGGYLNQMGKTWTNSIIGPATRAGDITKAVETYTNGPGSGRDKITAYNGYVQNYAPPTSAVASTAVPATAPGTPPPVPTGAGSAAGAGAPIVTNGGSDPARDAIVTAAKSFIGSPGFAGWCEKLVESELRKAGLPGTGNSNDANEPSAAQGLVDARAQGRVRGKGDTPQAGDVIYYEPNDPNLKTGDAGHTAIYVGDGQMITSAWGGNQEVHQQAVTPGAIYARPAGVNDGAAGPNLISNSPQGNTNQTSTPGNPVSVSAVGATTPNMSATPPSTVNYMTNPAPPPPPPVYPKLTDGAGIGAALKSLTPDQQTTMLQAYPEIEKEMVKRQTQALPTGAGTPEKEQATQTGQSQAMAAFGNIAKEIQAGVEPSKAIKDNAEALGPMLTNELQLRQAITTATANQESAQDSLTKLEDTHREDLKKDAVADEQLRIARQQQDYAEADAKTAAMRQRTRNQWQEEDAKTSITEMFKYGSPKYPVANPGYLAQMEGAATAATGYSLPKDFLTGGAFTGTQGMEDEYTRFQRSQAAATRKEDLSYKVGSRKEEDAFRLSDYNEQVKQTGMDSTLHQLERAQQQQGFMRTGQEQAALVGVKGAGSNAEAASQAGALSLMHDQDLTTKITNAKAITDQQRKIEDEKLVDEKRRYDNETERIAMTRAHEDTLFNLSEVSRKTDERYQNETRQLSRMQSAWDEFFAHHDRNLTRSNQREDWGMEDRALGITRGRQQADDTTKAGRDARNLTYVDTRDALSNTMRDNGETVKTNTKALDLNTKVQAFASGAGVTFGPNGDAIVGGYTGTTASTTSAGGGTSSAGGGGPNGNGTLSPQPPSDANLAVPARSPNGAGVPASDANLAVPARSPNGAGMPTPVSDVNLAVPAGSPNAWGRGGQAPVMTDADVTRLITAAVVTTRNTMQPPSANTQGGGITGGLGTITVQMPTTINLSGANEDTIIHRLMPIIEQEVRKTLRANRDKIAAKGG